MNHRDRFLFSVVLVAGLTITTGLDAQVNFETAYGNGVHYYFSGDYQKAVDSLSLAIDQDSADPRAYYYRGLANERLGNAAESDFKTGARMEVVRGGRLSIVNDALERVQGISRVSIEDHRRTALLAGRSSAARQPVVARPFPRTDDQVTTVGSTAAKEPAPETTAAAPGQEVLPAAKIMARPIKVDDAESKTADKIEGPQPDQDAPLKEVGFDEVVPSDDKKTESVEESIFGSDDAPMPKEDAAKADVASPFDTVEEEPKKEESTGSPFDTVEEKKEEAVPVPADDKGKEDAPEDPFDL